MRNRDRTAPAEQRSAEPALTSVRADTAPRPPQPPALLGHRPALLGPRTGWRDTEVAPARAEPGIHRFCVRRGIAGSACDGGFTGSACDGGSPVPRTTGPPSVLRPRYD